MATLTQDIGVELKCSEDQVMAFVFYHLLHGEGELKLTVRSRDRVEIVTHAINRRLKGSKGTRDCIQFLSGYRIFKRKGRVLRDASGPFVRVVAADVATLS